MKQTDKDVVERVASVFQAERYVSGPKMNLAPCYKPIYEWRVTGKRAETILDLMFPLLGNRRREKAQEALTAYRSRSTKPGRRKKEPV